MNCSKALSFRSLFHYYSLLLKVKNFFWSIEILKSNVSRLSNSPFQQAEKWVKYTETIDELQQTERSARQNSENLTNISGQRQHFYIWRKNDRFPKPPSTKTLFFCCSDSSYWGTSSTLPHCLWLKAVLRQHLIDCFGMATKKGEQNKSHWLLHFLYTEHLWNPADRPLTKLLWICTH